MKNSTRRVLALLLVLCMALSLVPMAALAAEDEQAEEVPAGSLEADQRVSAEDHPAGEDAAKPASSTTYPDGAVTDGWVQDTQTVRGTGSICEVRSGKLHLKVGSGNANNGDAWTGETTGTGPAVFISDTMKNALQPENGVYRVTFKMKPLANNMCCGVYLNYKNPNAGMLMGYNGEYGWFWQQYGAVGGTYANVSGLTLTEGTTYNVELTWNPTAKTYTYKTAAEGSELTAIVTDQTYAVVHDTEAIGEINNIAFKLGKSNTGVLGEMEIWDLHYSGQTPVVTYDIAGKVTDSATGAGVEGATVTIGNKTATTDAQGIYTIPGFDNGTYSATVTKENYWDGALANISVDGADVTTANIAIDPITYVTLSGAVKDDAERAVAGAAVVAVNEEKEVTVTATTDNTGAYSMELPQSLTYAVTVSKGGYVTDNQNVEMTTENKTLDVTLRADNETLSTADMDVIISKSFPQVIEYRMKGDLAGKVMYGQTDVLNSLNINGVSVTPTVTAVKAESGDKMTYTMVCRDDANHIDCTITADLVAKGKVLEFNITSVEYTDESTKATYPIESIYIPNHSLISVRTDEPEAALAGYHYGDNTMSSGDLFYDLTQGWSETSEGYFNAFLSKEDLAAGISGNSEYGSASTSNFRVWATKETRSDGGTYIGMNSATWYYDRKVTSSGDGSWMTDVIPADKKIVGVTEMPLTVKVCITGDENGNNVVDWQDAAILARDTIIHKPFRSEEVPDMVSTRIAMNFGSQAQNPFLTSLDNAKRVYLHTDGLGQAILLKGYAGEGHDSNHPDYYNVGQRMGGVEDFKTMLEKGDEIGAKFGIHVNASEFYPEADAFSDDAVLRNSDGSLAYGWNWIDQGVNLNGIYDLATGNRANRFARLHKLLGGDEGDKLSFIYVDVWGNGQSNKEDAWKLRKLDNEITKQNGWRIAHEWAFVNEYDSTFQHWSSDFAYGGYSDKGRQNSEIMRFIYNNMRDSFTGDNPTYGGCTNAPLLGGMTMQGFEGWQKDYEYDDTIFTIFDQMLPGKFLQHYDVVEWIDGEPVDMPWASSASRTPGPVVIETDSNGNPVQQSGTDPWTPEVYIRLTNEDGDEVVVTRGSTGQMQTQFSYETEADKVEYRSRVITLNGKVILRGAANAGDLTNNAPAGNMSYLIPWEWDANGNALTDQKLYHYNVVGGNTTWELPAGWETLKTVKMYELTDQGRINETIFNVSNGWVTLKAEAGHYYVVVKGENGVAAPTVEWSTGTHLSDVSFNAALEDSWNVEGTGTAVVNRGTHNIPMLQMNGQVSVSQVMTGLEPNTNYVAYVGVDNRSDAEAHITITAADGTELADNYTIKSIAKNYISGYAHHNRNVTEDGSSYFQNMYVYFTTPADANGITLKLERKAGEGNTYFDDVRILKTEAANFTYDNTSGELTEFNQDFEHVPQGMWPFVVGPIEDVEDNRQHLSELHAPYTQAGWDVKKLDDVIAGDWSLKVNGLVQRSKLVFQTIPQNFRFEPGKTYIVEFKYEMGSEGIYQIVVGDGEWNGDVASCKTIDLEKTLNLATTAEQYAAVEGTAKATVKTIKFPVVGAESGQTWIGIYSTATAPDYGGASGNAQNFGGYKEIVVDDLKITVSQVDKAALAALVEQGDGMAQADYSGNWDAFTTALETAHTIMDKLDATEEEVTNATTALQNAINALTKIEYTITGTVTDSATNQPIAGAKVLLENTSWVPVEGIDAVTTNERGEYTITGMAVGTYKLRVSAHNYKVNTVDATGLTVDNASVTVNAALTAEPAAPYSSNFDNGGIGKLQVLAGSTVKAEPVTYDGSGAVKITFGGGNRDQNNIIDASSTMGNGTISFDVTALSSGKRFGLSLRAQSNIDRLFLGQFDHEGEYGWEYWPGNINSSYSLTAYKGPAITEGVTRHVEVTLNGSNVTLTIDGVSVMDNLAMTNDYWPTYTGSTEPGSVGFVDNYNYPFIIDNIRLAPTDVVTNAYAISGKVVTGTDTPVVDAEVQIKKDGETVTHTSTAADGTFVTVPVEAGTYTVEVNAPGYTTAKKENVTVGTEAVNVGNITLTVDKEALRTLYNEQHARTDENDYTETSWQALTDALSAANTVLADDNATAEQIVAAQRAITEAMDGLVKKAADKSALRTAYNRWTAPNAGDNYTAESWGVFQTALKEAKAVLDDTSVTQSQVDAAKAALDAAAAKLVEKANSHTVSGSVVCGEVGVANVQVIITVTDSETEEVVARINTGMDGSYTASLADGSYTITASADGYEVTEPVTITVNGADVTAEAIVLTVDKEELQSLYDANKDKAESAYTSESWAPFKAALDEADAVLKNGSATPTDVIVATNKLTSAVEGLVEDIKADLRALYEANKDKTQGNYTDASWATFTAALEAAKTVLEKNGATQDEIDNAKTALDNAIAGLAEKPAPAPGGSTGRPAPSTTTETVENPDGSTTTTVTEPDGTVTETTTQPDGAKTEKVTSPEEGTTITVTDAEGEVEVQVTVPATIPAVSEENRFVDVPKGHWADQAIHEIASLGMVKGVNEVEHVYDMTSAMTRGTIATVLYRFSHGKTGLENVFQDVAQGQWYTDGVAWAAKTGVVTGYNDGTNFGPNDVITREQMATMMARYAKLIGMDTAAEATELDAFDDGAKTSDWATNGIAWCVKAGILQGKGGNILDPKANITRAEAAVMLQRFIELIK